MPVCRLAIRVRIADRRRTKHVEKRLVLESVLQTITNFSITVGSLTATTQQCRRISM